MPHQSSLPGAGQESVTTIHDVLEGKVVPGTNVLLLDDINGWWPATGTALHLAKQRHQVTIATASEKAAGQLDYSVTGDTARERLAKHGVEVLIATAVKSWDNGSATLVNLYTGDEEVRAFDTLVLATTNLPEDGLTRALEGSGLDVHAIGDAIHARTASMAIYEARELAMRI
jgi:NADH dehydrogenase FAD-containing subunit